MRRREFIGLMGGTVAWSRSARAQSGYLKIGVLLPGSEADPSRLQRVAVFRESLAKLGWLEGKNIEIALRWGGEDAARFAAMAKELVALQPAVLYCDGTTALRALKDQTSTIPTVFVAVTDPVNQGFVQSLSQPGGNATGFSATVEPSLPEKWPEFLAQLAPPIERLAVIFNDETSPFAGPIIATIRDAAGRLSLSVVLAEIKSIPDIDPAISEIGQRPNSGLMVIPGAFTVSNRKRIIDACARYRVPAIYFYTYIVTEGGLMAYGSNPIHEHRRAAEYVNRILRGESASSLPVQRPIKFDLVINLRTAKALGVTVAPNLVALADEVLE